MDTIPQATGETRRRIPIPREHGAWAVLYGPFMMALLMLSEVSGPPLILLVVVTALFLAHEPLAKLLRSVRHGARREIRKHWWKWLTLYALAAVVGTLYLTFARDLWQLLSFGAVGAILFAIHLAFVYRRTDRTLVAELTGLAGLTLTGPAALYAGKGTLGDDVYLLWVLSLLYFSSGVFFVKMKVGEFLKTSEYSKRRQACVAYHCVLAVLLFTLALLRSIPPLLPLAYAPAVIRAFWALKPGDGKLDMKRTGYVEVGLTLVFLALFGIFWNRG